MLHEGRAVVIFYSASNPQRAVLGMRWSRAVMPIAGVALMVAGMFVTLLCLWLLVGGPAGWVEVRPFAKLRFTF
jgi:hypothetical protein